MFCSFTRPRYQVSVYRTIGPLVYFNMNILKTWQLYQIIPSSAMSNLHGKVIHDLVFDGKPQNILSQILNVIQLDHKCISYLPHKPEVVSSIAGFSSLSDET